MDLTCAFRGPGAHVVGQDPAGGHVVPLHVDQQEVVPLPVVTETFIQVN